MRTLNETRFAVVWICMLLLIVVALLEPIGAASVVRGRLLRATPQGNYPAQQIRVTLNSQQYGRSNPTFSGSDGMYYLYNIPPGPYAVEVWVSNQPLTTHIQVGPQGYTDVPVIQLR
jgi:hypothetical protein